MEVLKAAKQLNPLSYVVVMTGYSSIETAIESIRCGAFDYLTKPFKLAEIEIVANRILEYLMLIDSRLEKIESLLGTLVAKIGP